MRVCGDYGLHLTQNLSVGELAERNHRSYANCLIWADKNVWDDSRNKISNCIRRFIYQCRMRVYG